MTPSSEAACNEVSSVLWQERDLLEDLAFALEMQRLVLCSGNDRWLPRACRRVEGALVKLRSAELLRAVRVAILAEHLGIEPSPSLRAVASAAVEPWSEIFHQHRQAFLELTGEVLVVAEHNRAHLGTRRDATVDGPPWLHPSGPPVVSEVAGQDLHVLLDERKLP